MFTFTYATRTFEGMAKSQGMYMIKNGFLTSPIKVDIPVTSYDFSALSEDGRSFTAAEIEEVLKGYTFNGKLFFFPLFFRFFLLSVYLVLITKCKIQLNQLPF